MKPVVPIDFELDSIYYSHQMLVNIPEPCKVLCGETCDGEQQVESARKKWKQSQRQRPLAAFAKIRIQKLNSHVVKSSKKPFFGAIRTESS